MKLGLGISIFLHLAIIGLVLLFSLGEQSRPSITSIEMVSLLSPQKSQKQRIKGVKNPRPKKTRKREIPDPATQTTEEEKIGNDTEDAPEVRGGTTDPQLLAVANYAQELQSYIEKNRYYPRRALVMEQTGIVKVRLRINAKGEFLNVEVVEPSPYEALNRAALDLVNGLGKFKPLPSSYRGSGEFDFPIRYSIERGS